VEFGSRRIKWAVPFPFIAASVAALLMSMRFVRDGSVARDARKNFATTTPVLSNETRLPKHAQMSND
jgi:hypothetical protein